MKNVTLNVGERLSVNNILNDYKGTLQGLNMVFKIMDKVSFNDKEMKALGMKQTAGADGSPQLTWDVKKDKGVLIEFSNDQGELLCEQIKARSESKEFSTSDRFLLSLAEKLGIEIGEEEEESKSNKKDDSKGA